MTCSHKLHKGPDAPAERLVQFVDEALGRGACPHCVTRALIKTAVIFGKAQGGTAEHLLRLLIDEMSRRNMAQVEIVEGSLPSAGQWVRPNPNAPGPPPRGGHDLTSVRDRIRADDNPQPTHYPIITKPS